MRGYRLIPIRSFARGVSVGAVTGAMGGETGSWRTFGEREIYRDPEVQLGQVDVELAGGERVWHHVVRLHQVAMMVLDEQNRALLVLAWAARMLRSAAR